MPSSPRWTALLEVVGFAALAVVSKLAVDPLTWRFSGPITLLATLLVLAMHWRRRGRSWRALGLRPLEGSRAWLLLVPQVLLGVVAILGTGIVVTKGAAALGLSSPDAAAEGVAARFGAVQGNLPLYLLWLALTWASAGLGEELFFRGFVIERLETVLAGLRAGSLLAVLLAALFFGSCHVYYQGLHGLLVAGTIGLVLGLLYLWYGRNLWPLIVAHALVDSLVLTAFFLDLDL